MGGGPRLGLCVRARALLPLPRLLLLLLLLAAASIAATPESQAPVAAAQEGPASVAATPESREPLAVELLGDDRVRVEARGVPRERVLAALARAADVELVEGAGRPAPRSVTVELADASVEDAFARVLEGVPYHLHYEAGDADAAVELRRVTVGLVPAAPAEAARETPPKRARARPPARRAGAGDAARSEEERRERVAALHDSRSEDDRAEAATLMQPDADLPALVAALRDPSARVRAAAAGSLGHVELSEDAFRATDALVGALGDADPAVVAAAVEALEAVYDVLPHPRIRAAVEQLGDPDDPDVRAAVESFREWAEDTP